MSQPVLSSPEEIKILTGYFMHMFDKDQDGLLKPDELNSMLSFLYNQPYQDKALSSFFGIWDTNGDGKVDAIDVERVCRRYLLGEGKPRVEKAKKKVFSKEALQRLEVARRLFRMFDKDGSNTLGPNEVRLLMQESYKDMGIKFDPSESEVLGFMEMISGNTNKLLHLEDYEDYVLKSLKEAGINVDGEQMKI